LRRGLPRLSPGHCRCLHGPAQMNEHTPVPMYPPCPRQTNYNEAKTFMKNLKTVEEKQYQINRPKYYGWYSYILTQDWQPFDSLEFLQFATQTHVVGGLPEYYTQENKEVDTLVEELAPKVEKVLLNDALHNKRGFDVENDKLAYRERHAVNYNEHFGYIWEKKRAEVLVRELHQVVMSHLMAKSGHLKESSEDFNARNQAFWFRGGIGPDKSMIKKREGVQKMYKRQKDKGLTKPSWGPHGLIEKNVDKDGHPTYPQMTHEEVMKPYERCLQYNGSNTVQVRCNEPLPAWVPRDHDLVTDSKVPWVPHDPREWGYKTQHQNGVNIPGYWADEENQHGLLLLATRTNYFWNQAIGTKEVITDQVIRDGNTSRALLSCFGWLLPQACHLGFSPMTEMTFPLATQACFTDGRIWSHYAYQLNTSDLTHNNEEDFTHNNLLWVGEDQVLYDRIEEGRLVNYNPSVLGNLVRQYLREPASREYSLTPYLGEKGRLSQFHDKYQRQYLMGNHRHMYSQRPRHYEKPEMYLWEKIHLIDHKGPFEKMMGLRRRRWFQMYKVDQHGKQHWHPEFKQYDEERHRYIPRAFRQLKHNKKGFERRFTKNSPKVTVPLQDEVSVYNMPDIKYNKKKPLTGYAWKNNKDQGPGFN